jgi:hypothetical protein
VKCTGVNMIKDGTPNLKFSSQDPHTCPRSIYCK